FGGPGTMPDPIVAHAFGRPMRASDFRNARIDWEMLTSNRITTFAPMGQFGPRQVPLGALLGRPNEQQLLPLLLPGYPSDPQVAPAPVGVIAAERDAFALLLREAEQMGVVIPDSVVQERMAELAIQVRDEEERALAIRAVRSFLMAQAAFDRLASAAKVSTPVVRRMMDTRLVELRLDAVEFDANAMTPQQPGGPATATADAQLQAQFDKYADVAPGQPTESNPMGFGYRVPDRVRVQWLAIDPAAVRAAVLAGPPPAGASSWDVAALKYYYSRRDEFPAATQPATSPATGAATQAVAAAATTRPSPEVVRQALDKVVQPEVDRRVSDITARLQERFAAAYNTAGPTTAQAATTAPAAGPTTVPASGFGSYAFLESAAADVQKQFGVLPASESRTNTWLTLRELNGMPGIGQVSEFGRQAIGVALGGDDAPRPLQLSRPLKAGDGTTYLFQVVAAEASHKPASLDAVRDQVAADVRRTEPFDAAKAAAEQLLASAKTTGLADAARAAGKQVLNIGPLSQRTAFADVPNYSLAPDARAALVDGALKLLSFPTTAPSGHPVGTIMLPAANKVLVAQVVSARPESIGTDEYRAGLFVTNQLEQAEQQALQQEWFAWPNVTARAQYREDSAQAAAE
ncbi:MAG TPA: hypothetical protein VK324_10630, partial [Tepidisphaeraceae bacterium]|nr:hypothetical protein [Tepidisphaeraceae bacterium]